MRKSIKKYLYVTAVVFLFSACADSAVEENSSSSDASGGSTATATATSSSGSSSGSSSSSSSSSSSGSGSSSSSSGISSTSSLETLSEAYSASSPIFEIDSSVGILELSGLSSGQSVYMIKTNPSSTAISASYTRYVSSAEGISLSSGNVPSTSSSSSSGGTPSSAPWSHGHGSNHCRTLSLNENLEPAGLISSSRAASSSLSAATQITPLVGETTKSIYVDNDSDISTFKSRTSTLRAVGEYCYVWVVGDTSSSTYWTDESLSSGGEGEQINSEIAQSIADNFDKIYPMVRNVFGNESDNLIYGGKQYSMETYSDTGCKVNIVVYDIGMDYSSSSGGDVVGYFYAKDYYKGSSQSVYKYSNGGKYFYIDAYYAANYTSMVFSTLAHEFQHMVDWGVKYMEQDISTETWFNEMLSMLCEDMMKQYLEENNSDFSDDDSPLSRLPMFNRHYYDTGLEYKTSGTYDVYYSYANNYAFGAWLLRNYGGMSLLNKLSTNAYADIDSIVNATGLSMEELLKEYGKACLINEAGSGFNLTVTSEDYSWDGYKYPLDAIDLWSLEEYLPDLYETCSSSSSYSNFYTFDGPLYFGYDKQQEIRPYGFTLSKVGTATDSEVKITFSTGSSSGSQKLYVLVAD